MSLKSYVWFVLVVACSGLFSVQAQEDVEPLTQTYQSASNRISFNYPETWALDEAFPGAMTLTSNIDMLSTIEPLQSGKVRIRLFTPRFFDDEFSLPDDSNPTTALLTFLDWMNTELPRQPTELVLGNKSAVRVTLPSDGRTNDMMLVVDTGDNSFALMLIVVPTDEEDPMPTVLAIAESLAYYKLPIPSGTPEDIVTDLVETFRSEYGPVSFNYPEGWIAEDDDEGLAFLSNVDIEDVSVSEFDPGHIVIMIATSAVTREDLGLDEDATLMDISADIIERFENPPIKITNFSVGTHSGLSIIFDNADETFLIVTLIETNSQHIGVLVAQVVQSELDRFEPVIKAIAATVTYQGELQ